VRNWFGFCVGFLLLLVVNHWFLEWCYRRGAPGIRWLVQEGGREHDYLILGSSAAYNAIDPAILCEELDASILDRSSRGSSYAEHYLTLDLYLARNRTTCLILEVDTWGLSPTSYTYPFHDYLFVPYLDDPIVRRHVAEYCGTLRMLCWRWIPMAKHGEFNTQYGPKAVWRGLVQPDNYRPNVKDMPDRGMTGGTLEKVRSKAPFRYQISAQRESYLCRMLELAQHNNVQVVMCLAPEYEEHARLLVNRRAIVDHYAAIARTYKIPFFVWPGPQGLGDPDLFCDPKHLNHRGAQRFSEALCDFIRQESSPAALLLE